jgi:hypothetical protein
MRSLSRLRPNRRQTMYEVYQDSLLQGMVLEPNYERTSFLPLLVKIRLKEAPRSPLLSAEREHRDVLYVDRLKAVRAVRRRSRARAR